MKAPSWMKTCNGQNVYGPIKLPRPRNGPPARKKGQEKGVLLFERLCLFYFAAITRHKSLSKITENPALEEDLSQKGWNV